MKPWLQLHCVFRVVANEMQHSKARLVKGVLRGDSYSYSSQQTWDVPRPVRFDSDVRKRVITVEANKLEKRNPIQADGIEG